MIFFTSDCHFGHAKLAQMRGFSSIEEHDRVIASAWRDAVGRSDEVNVIGDFSFHKLERTIGILRSLPGQKHLIVGNHDQPMIRKPAYRKLWGSVSDIRTVRVADNSLLAFRGSIPERSSQRIELCHYAMRVWNQSHYGAWHLHGHSHGTLPSPAASLSMDVGVDTRRDGPQPWQPWSYVEIKAHMASKTFRPADYHGRCPPHV
jgi:calcineurin-like phosphoesterase family protein